MENGARVKTIFSENNLVRAVSPAGQIQLR
jgi:hypothetical protein